MTKDYNPNDLLTREEAMAILNVKPTSFNEIRMFLRPVPNPRRFHYRYRNILKYLDERESNPEKFVLAMDIPEKKAIRGKRIKKNKVDTSLDLTSMIAQA